MVFNINKLIRGVHGAEPLYGQGSGQGQSTLKLIVIPWKYVSRKGDAMVLLVGRRTCNFQVAGSSPGWASSRSGLGQATYTCVPLAPSSKAL